MDAHPSIRKTQAIPRLSRSAGLEPIPFLQVLSGAQSGQIVLLDRDCLRMGRDATCEISLAEVGISRDHAVILREEGQWRLRDQGSTNGTFVNDLPVEDVLLKEGDRIDLGPHCTLKFGRQPRAEVELAQRLFEGARLDGLTRVFNRATFFERLEQEVSFSERQGLVFCLILFDIDHFKRINDSYGHPAGDAVLCQVANRARALLRLEDTLGRYGGEEFAILLRNTELPAALRAAERLRLEVADHPFLVSDECHPEEVSIPVTLSAGCCSWKPGLTQEIMLSQADQALYRAKSGGRNQVCPG